MAANIEFKADTTDLQKMVRYFSEKDWKTVKKRALSSGANTLKKEAKKSLKTLLPNSTKRSDKYKDKLIDAIRSSKIQDKGLAEMTVKVHTMGTKKSGSGTFRTRFFEGGTKERTQKPRVVSKGRKYTHSRKVGKIKALHFFSDSVSNSKIAETDITKVLEEQIQKINNKKYS